MWLSDYINLLQKGPTSPLLSDYYLKRAEIHCHQEIYQEAIKDAQNVAVFEQCSEEQKANDIISRAGEILKYKEQREKFATERTTTVFSLQVLARHVFLNGSKLSELKQTKVTPALRDCEITPAIIDQVVSERNKQEKEKAKIPSTAFKKMTLG